MTASPATANVTVVPNTPLTGTFTLTNLSSTTLTGLTATASGGPAGLTVQLTPPGQIAGNGTATLAYSLDDTVDAGGLRRGDDPGRPPPRGPFSHPHGRFGLAADADPGGRSRVIELPAWSSVLRRWCRSRSSIMAARPAATFKSVCPARLTCRWRPPRRSPRWLPGIVHGHGRADPAGQSAAGRVHRHDRREQRADRHQRALHVHGHHHAPPAMCQVLVDDDYTFDEAGSPRVQGATVSLLNPYDNTDVVATGVTDASGGVTFTNVPAGPYDLQVTAPATRITTTPSRSFRASPTATRSSSHASS